MMYKLIKTNRMNYYYLKVSQVKNILRKYKIKPENKLSIDVHPTDHSEYGRLRLLVFQKNIILYRGDGNRLLRFILETK